MNHTFVIGFERCGTHGISNILRESCIVPSLVTHEPIPCLCYEASQVVSGGEWLTRELKHRVEKYKTLEQFQFICEANHRLCFVSKYINENIPDAKFVLMVRDPVKTLVSRVATLAHWPVIIDRYPEFYRINVKKYVPPCKDVFNTFRPEPKVFSDHLYEIYLWEWIETYRITIEQTKNIKNLMIWETREMKNSVDKLLDFIGRDMFDFRVAAKEATKRADSIYERSNNLDLIAYAWEMFEPHADEIYERIKKEFPDDPIIKRITTA
jgi:hypothetical protein